MAVSASNARVLIQFLILIAQVILEALIKQI